MQVCKIGKNRLREALDLVWEVFEKYDLPDYEEIGVKTFQHFIEYGSMTERMTNGEMQFWGCYLNNYLVGVIALRKGQHISLLFVRDKFHHLGIATKLVKVAVAAVMEEEPKIRAVSVNSSPYAVEFYKKMGFETMGDEKKADGIRFTSMRLNF